MNSRNLSFEQRVNADPSLVYHAFTNATTLRDFFCNIATVDPKPGGRIYMAWEAGYYTAGLFTQLEENQKVGFSWLGRDDPGPTEVEILLKPLYGGTIVRVIHKGLGIGEAWDFTAQEFEKGWNNSLENLASILETGEDLRFVRRPMMGIFYGDFTKETAKEIGVPVSEGVRLGGVGEGMSAQAAGLQKDDVLVELDGKSVISWNDLGPILQSRRAGDQVDVTFYRGTELKTIKMTLGKRPIPEIPSTADRFSELMKVNYGKNIIQLDQVFQGVTDEMASSKRGPDEWNPKEVLAHLILGERFNVGFVAEILSGFERWADDFGGNENTQIKGMLAAYPTLDKLREELKNAFTVVTVMLASLPGDFPQKNKAAYWRMAYNFLQPDYHFQEHLEQIKNALESGK